MRFRQWELDAPLTKCFRSNLIRSAERLEYKSSSRACIGINDRLGHWYREQYKLSRARKSLDAWLVPVRGRNLTRKVKDNIDPGASFNFILPANCLYSSHCSQNCPINRRSI